MFRQFCRCVDKANLEIRWPTMSSDLRQVFVERRKKPDFVYLTGTFTSFSSTLKAGLCPISTPISVFLF